MAGAGNRIADMAEQDTEAPVAAEGLMLQDILTPGVNLAEHLTDEEVTTIGQHVIRDVAIDERSRGKGEKGSDEGWLGRYHKWLDMAMQVRQSKNFPWPGASNVKFPLLTVASIQFQARAYPAIVDGSNLVKGRVLGPDPDGQKRARADRIGQHMSYQLLYKMPGWEEDTDRLLLLEPIVGCVFRKTYYDSILNTNRSDLVTAEDFIINYWAKSLETAPRFTHVLRYHPHEVMEKVAAGLWLSVKVEHDGEDSDDESALVEFYEQHRMIDLDKDGYPEPYVVTTNKEGGVARIVPCFGPDEVTVMNLATQKPVRLSKIIEVANEQPEAWGLAGHVVKIERRQYFTKYGFIPAPDGSFYDIGFGALLEDILEPINTSVNQMLDAGALQNAGGGFLGSGINAKGGNLTFRLGEWKRLDTSGGLLKDNIYQLEHPGPSDVLFNLLTLLIEQAKDIAGATDALTGGSPATEQPTTLLARIEQAQKVMSAIFKRIWRSFGQELRILRRLNRDYLDEEEYFQLNDGSQTDPDAQQQDPAIRIGRDDYQDADLDVEPVADPTMVGDVHKMAVSEAEWQSFNGDPLVNQVELRRRRMDALGVKDIPAMLKVPPPAPDPKMLIESMKEARAKIETAAKVRGIDAKSALDLLGAAELAFQLGLMNDAESLARAAEELGGSHDEHIAPGGVSGMEAQPPDGGVPGPAPQPPAVPEGPMGGGAPVDGGAAGAGGALGPIGGDQL